MSVEKPENSLKNKLMEILEDELSALRLKDVNNNYENHLSEHFPGKTEARTAYEEDISSVIRASEPGEIDPNEKDTELYKENEAVKPLSSPVKKELRDLENTFKDDASHQEKDKAPEMFHKRKYGNNTDKMDLNYEEGFISPPEDLVEKVLERIEFCFQDYNIFKNSFLLNQIQKNKYGYVNLRVISNLRKIRGLTSDPRVVAYCIRKSNVMELNPENNKVRRIEPIPNIEDTSVGKTLMIFNLPHQNMSKGYLKELFSKFGSVVSADVFEIGSSESNEYHERCLYFHRRISSKVYGLVEFEKYDQVVNALKDEDGHLPKENEMKVVPLMPQIYKKERRLLKFLEPYYPNQRRGYGRYRPRDDFRNTRGNLHTANGGMRNEKYTAGNYPFKKNTYRRPYTGRKTFYSPSRKNIPDSRMSSEYAKYDNVSSKKWHDSRQLRANNGYNTERLYPNIPRRRVMNGYRENNDAL